MKKRKTKLEKAHDKFEELAHALAAYSMATLRVKSPYEIQVAKQAIRSTWSSARRRIVERKEGLNVQANQIEDLDFLRDDDKEFSPESRGRLQSKAPTTIKVRIDPQDMTLYCSHITEEVMTVAEEMFSGDFDPDWQPSQTVNDLAHRWAERHGDLGDESELIPDKADTWERAEDFIDI